MAIERMKKFSITCRAGSAQRLVRSLHQLGVVELIDPLEQLDHSTDSFNRPEAACHEAEERLQKINGSLAVLDTHYPDKKGFFEGLAPVPLIVEQCELDEAVAQIDIDDVYKRTTTLDESLRQLDHQIADRLARKKELEPWSELPAALSELRGPKRLHLMFGIAPAKGLLQLAADMDSKSYLAIDLMPLGSEQRGKDAPVARSLAELKPTTEMHAVVAAYVREYETEARKALSRAGFEEATLPALQGRVRDHLRELTADLAECDLKRSAILFELGTIAKQRRSLAVLKAFWESNRSKELAFATSATGRWVHLFAGYVRTIDVDRLQQCLTREFPDAILTLKDPGESDDVPVSLVLSPFTRPIQLLVNLFGLPSYNAFDPSPFIFANFFLFFGICFGDVGYGLMLLGLGLYIASKTRNYPGVYNFAMVFVYAGVSTIVFGVLLGSWFGDLPKYLGDGNFLEALRLKAMVLDPIEEPLVALGIALGIGMVSQLYGIMLKMYGAAKNGDWKAVVFDGVFWLITLPGMVLLIAGTFTELPATLSRIGLGMFASGAIGLVLTQGRDEPTLAGKFITGTVSIYGILGSYGCTAFVGDVLSYCRLLALGLTTGLVANAFNMMAGLVQDVPYVGMLLFALIAAFGHVFNFAMSVLGAFVHSMRLIFVEMFGRFYESGGKAFTPLGFDSKQAILRRSA